MKLQLQAMELQLSSRYSSWAKSPKFGPAISTWKDHLGSESAIALAGPIVWFDIRELKMIINHPISFIQYVQVIYSLFMYTIISNSSTASLSYLHLFLF